MNRRTFFTASVGSVIASKYTRAEVLLKNNNFLRNKIFYDNANLSFGTLSAKKLRDEYHNYLFDDFLPFLDKYVIDYKYGGFMCNTDLKGNHINTDKDIWSEGRGIWVYSFLYRNFGKDEKFLTIARNSLNLILKCKPQGNDLWTDRISREGKALTPSSKEISGDLLVAEGMCEYARASGEWKYWNTAKNIILKCWKIYNNSDYCPDIVSNYLGPKSFPFPGAKIQGVAMNIIMIINNMLEAQNDSDLEEIISECTNAVLNKHFNPEFNLNNELLNHNYSRPDNGLAQFVYTAISIEALWAIMKRAIDIKDVKMFETAAERFKRHVEVSWDDVYGGIFRSLNNVDKNLWEIERLCKVFWAQEEVLNGIMILIEQTGDKWAKDLWFEKMYKYIVSKFLLKQYGFPLWIINGDRKVTFHSYTDYNSVDNYHLPRNLMLTYLALDRIIKNNGKPAWNAAIE